MTVYPISIGQPIRCGNAVMPWAKQITRDGRGFDTPAGWVLPGGERTTDCGIALRVCAGMNVLMQGR